MKYIMPVPCFRAFFQGRPLRMRALYRACGLLLAAALLAGCASGTAQPPTQAAPPLAPTPSAAAPAAATPEGAAPTEPAANAASPTEAAATADATAPAPTPPEQPAFQCAADEITAALLNDLTPESWMGWVRRLSGAEPVTLGGEEVTITSRYTMAMFPLDGGPPLPNARAFEYVEETLRGWYPPEQIQTQEWSSPNRQNEVLRGKNLILTLPGAVSPAREALLTAHLDSRAQENSEALAPGAEDNASGAAALLEAARLLRGFTPDRTIRLIWFTGEEQGLLGSKAYVAALPDPGAVVGVLNLDMFGYDSDGDRCFEMHAGRLPASQDVAACFIQSAEEHDQGLDTFDYLTERAIGASDHGSFWEAGIGAIEILENMFNNRLPEGCAGADNNPNYHTPGDTADLLNADSGARIARTALATVIGMSRETGRGATRGAGTAQATPQTGGGLKEARAFLPAGAAAPALGSLASPASGSCGYASEISALLDDFSQAEWEGYLRDLSGAQPALVNGNPVTITTRFSPELFNGGSAGYEYVRERIYDWFPIDWIEEHAYVPPYPYNLSGPRWNNLILTIPGSQSSGGIATLLTAHLDSTSNEAAAHAPGADDNATGAAALLMAARALRDRPPDQRFPRALKLIWFTGEEQNLYGSRAYVNSRRMAGINGVVNIDMIGHDANGDRCFELHVGQMPESQRVGECFVEAIDAYAIQLTYEYMVSGATNRSDHRSFWDAGVGAVLALENFFTAVPAGACGPADGTPHYHTTNDTVAALSLNYAYDIARASAAAAFSLANQPVPVYYAPQVIRR